MNFCERSKSKRFLIQKEVTALQFNINTISHKHSLADSAGEINDERNFGGEVKNETNYPIDHDARHHRARRDCMRARRAGS